MSHADATDWRDVHDRLLAHFGPQHWWPGDSPFEVMVGAVLTQNTAWRNVEKAIGRLKVAQALSCNPILAIPIDELACLIRPAGFFNVKSRRLKALCQFLAERGVAEAPEALARQARVDALRKDLLAVYGVGEETADSILLYALDLPVFVVDAYTRRIFGRLGLLDGNEAYGDIQARFHARLPAEVALFNEYHALIVALGKTCCRPRPRCGVCPLVSRCPGRLPA
ncbi:MAG: endonuclease [Pseudomonadota bacterium]